MSISGVQFGNTPAFRGNGAVKQNVQQPKQEHKNDGKKLALALGGLAVAGVTAFALYKSGKFNSLKNKLSGFKNKDSKGTGIKIDPTKPKTDTVIGVVADNINKPKVDLGKGIKEFRANGGKFDRGIALNADGSKYTGNLLQTGKDGTKFIIEYKDGKMISSIKTGANGQVLGGKTYQYNCDGTMRLSGKVEDARNLALQRRAEQAQNEFNKPFKDKLSNRSAKDSAQDFIDDINTKAQQRTEQEQRAIREAKEAQARFNKPFEDALSNRSAEESANAIDEILIEEAQAKYNKPFTDKLSRKSASESFGTYLDDEFKAKSKIKLPDSPDFAQDMKDAYLHGTKIDPTKYGFSAEGKWHTFPDGSKEFVYEGPGLYDITSDGKLLIKEYADWYKALLKGKQPQYRDCTSILHDGANILNSQRIKAPTMVLS